MAEITLDELKARAEGVGWDWWTRRNTTPRTFPHWADYAIFPCGGEAEGSLLFFKGESLQAALDLVAAEEARRNPKCWTCCGTKVEVGLEIGQPYIRHCPTCNGTGKRGGGDE